MALSLKRSSNFSPLNVYLAWCFGLLLGSKWSDFNSHWSFGWLASILIWHYEIHTSAVQIYWKFIRFCAFLDLKNHVLANYSATNSPISIPIAVLDSWLQFPQARLKFISPLTQFNANFWRFAQFFKSIKKQIFQKFPKYYFVPNRLRHCLTPFLEVEHLSHPLRYSQYGC